MKMSACVSNLHQQRVCGPTVDDTPAHFRPVSSVAVVTVDGVQTAACEQKKTHWEILHYTGIKSLCCCQSLINKFPQSFFLRCTFCNPKTVCGHRFMDGLWVWRVCLPHVWAGRSWNSLRTCWVWFSLERTECIYQELAEQTAPWVWRH